MRGPVCVGLPLEFKGCGGSFAALAGVKGTEPLVRQIMLEESDLRG